jgi:hypothetical protein
MLDDRNLSSHIYDDKTSEEIFDRIKNVYLKQIKETIDYLEEKINLL